MGQMQFMYGNDPGMPALGTLGVGDLVRVLDAALNAGGTTQSITSITRSGTTATATKVGHLLRSKQIVTISGAAQADYNGNFRITVTSSSTFTFTVANSPVTPATGTILAKLAPLGSPLAGGTTSPWGIAFTATNQRAYRAAAGLRHYFMANDNSGTNTCIVRGFTAMSAVTTGTGPFPTVAQSSTNLRWHRPDPTAWPDTGPPSGTPGVNNDSWVIIGDDRRFFLGITTSNSGWRTWYFFGEAISLKPADAYHTFISGFGDTGGADLSNVQQTMLTSYGQPSQVAASYYTNATWTAARAQGQVTASWNCVLQAGFAGPSPNAAGGLAGTPALGYSSPMTAGIELATMYLTEYSVAGIGNRRAIVPGLVNFWNTPDYLNNDSTVYTGINNFPDVLLVRGNYADNANGLGFWVGDWDTVPS